MIVEKIFLKKNKSVNSIKSKRLMNEISHFKITHFSLFNKIKMNEYGSNKQVF